MEYSAESIRYLHIAFTILIVTQAAYAVWLITRWLRTSKQLQELRRSR